MQLDCIERVTQHGEMTVYQGSSTPRLAPCIVLKSARNEQPQQQQDVLSQSRGKLAGHPNDDQSIVQKEPLETDRTLSEAPSLNNAAKEQNSFQVNLRVHGVSQDDIYKDEEDDIVTSPSSKT